jgi:hypothetical protein
MSGKASNFEWALVLDIEALLDLVSS